jgi:DNA mismatch repair protein MutS
MSDSARTPMMQQYRELKARDPDALLLFRMGDFYEMFGDDAHRASELLGLVLTSRDKEKGEAAMPMAGFPHHQLESYLGRLVAAGLRAAVCEQVEDAKQSKGLVKREVVRVVTPGTVTDDALLDPRRSNYLASVVETKGRLGIAWVELSTGEFQIANCMRHELADDLTRLEPAEVLVSETQLEATWTRIVREQGRAALTARPSWDFQIAESHANLCAHFGTTTLSGFGVEDDDDGIGAAGALLSYLRETQRSALGHLVRIGSFRRSDTMSLDAMTRRGLELTRTLRLGERKGSLLESIDATVTPMGSRLLSHWIGSPLLDLTGIVERHAAIDELRVDAALRVELRSRLGRAADLERLSGRIGTGRATPRDLAGLGKTLGLIPVLRDRLAERGDALLIELRDRLDPCEELRGMIAAALVDDPPLALREGGLIRDGYHGALDELRSAASGGKTWIARFQADEIRRTGISSLKVGFNKVFGYYIEVTHTHASKVPDTYIRKQTVKNAERYITPELKEYEDQVLRAEERAKELEYELFLELRDRVGAEAPRIVQIGRALAQIDVLAALAEVAAQRRWCRPEMVVEPVLEIESGRHPVLDSLLPAGEFVPNDIRLGGEGGTILLLTGPNMAGKSTYIRQAALLVMLAQAGSFVPARSARIGLVDKLFARVGATDELGRGLSTFMVEMTETANILHNATGSSLVILDEIGRGTSTFDGISLAWAIAEDLHDRVGCRTLFATHYHELVDLENSKPRLRNANVLVREQEGEIVFLHRIAPGGADQSYGIHVARLAGVPAGVLERAREILIYLERQHSAAPDSGGEAESAAPARMRKPKTGRALQNSLFAAIPDPLLNELQEIDLDSMTAEGAIALLRRLRSIASSVEGRG